MFRLRIGSWFTDMRALEGLVVPRQAVHALVPGQVAVWTEQLPTSSLLATEAAVGGGGKVVKCCKQVKVPIPQCKTTLLQVKSPVLTSSAA